MQTGIKGINLIKVFEGVRLEAYKPVPTEKYWTIGYGHYGAEVKAGMHITMEQAEKYLVQDLKKFEKAVTNTKIPLNQNQFDALVSFTYNCGEGNLKTLVNNRTLEQIGNSILKYNKAGGKELAGLTKRRKAEHDLFFTPVTVLDLAAILPFEIKTNDTMKIRREPSISASVVRTVSKNTKLKVWAIQTINNEQWGKNGDEWYRLSECHLV